jgi:AAHS family 3-hydroxyphenylpropionic acid transporter
MTEAKSGSGALLTLGLCLLVAMVEGIDIQSIGVAAPRLAPEFKLSHEQLGYVLAAGPLGLFLGAGVGGRLADRLGRKRVLMAAMALFGLFTLATVFCTGYETLLPIRLLTGLGLGGALPNLIALTAEAVGAGRRNAVVGLTAGGMPLGAIAVSFVATHWAGPAEWRMIFWLGGIAPIVLAAILWLALPESRRFVAVKAQGLRVPILKALFGEGRAKASLTIGISFFCSALVLYLMLNWLPTLMVGKGFSKPDAAWIQGGFNIGGATGAVVLGWLMDRKGRALVMLVSWAAIAGSLLALGAMGHDLTQACAVGFVAGAFVAGVPLILFGLASEAYATAFRGTGVGFCVSLGRLGSIVGPLAAAALISGGRSSSEVLTAFLPVVALGGLAAVWAAMGKRAED